MINRIQLTPVVGDVLRYKTRNMPRARYYAVAYVQVLPVQHMDGTPPGRSIDRYTLRRCRQDGSPSTGNFDPVFSSRLSTAAGWSTTPAKAKES